MFGFLVCVGIDVYEIKRNKFTVLFFLFYRLMIELEIENIFRVYEINVIMKMCVKCYGGMGIGY